MNISNAYELRKFLNQFSAKELKGARVWASYSEDVESGTVDVDEYRTNGVRILEEIQILASADDI